MRLGGRIFADDTVIMAESHHELVQKLAQIEFLTSSNSMEVNLLKCGIIEIEIDERIEVTELLQFGNEYIPVVQKYFYLGVELNSKLDLACTAKYRINRDLETLARIRSTLVSNRASYV